LQATLISVAP